MVLRAWRPYRSLPSDRAVPGDFNYIEKVPGDLNYTPIATTERQLAHADALRELAELHPCERAEYLVEAEDYYDDADHPEEAEQAYRAALADGGPVTYGSAHGSYAEFHPRPPRRGPRGDRGGASRTSDRTVRLPHDR